MGRLSDRQVQMAFEKQWRRNVLAQPGCHEFMIVCDGLKSDYNIGKIFRSAEAFGAQSIHLVGIEYFNPYPARGTLRQVPARFFKRFELSYAALRDLDYTPFMLVPSTQAMLSQIMLPKRSAFIVGHEEFGHSFKAEDYPGIIPIRIPMYGQGESLNVSIAASIVMYEYTRQHAPECGDPGRAEKSSG